MSPVQTDYELIGIGFGPANLAIAAALTEDPTFPDVSSKNILFIERHVSFRWHPGMLLPGAKMQISFLKDLATLRDPKSPYTFISYLHQHNRLDAFINRGSTTPTRKEFADYLTWVAGQVEAQGIIVNYGQQVVSLQEIDNSCVEVQSRDVRTGKIFTQTARNIIVSTGGSPFFPRVFEPIFNNPLCIHSSCFAFTIEQNLRDLASLGRPLRICVVGSGQSAAEVTMNLKDRLSGIDAGDSRHEIEVIIRKGSFKPSDDSPFSNEIFDPSSTDVWYSTTSQALKDARLAEYHSTNYGVVNPKTLDALYEIIYDQKVDQDIASRSAGSLHEPYIRLLPNTSILSAEIDRDDNTFCLVTRDALCRALSEHRYDLVVSATGYQRTSWTELLGSSNLGARYGIQSGSSVKLVQANATHNPSVFSRDKISQGSPRSLSPSSDVTPLTSPEDSGAFEDYKTSVVSISRSYRLIPVNNGSQWPRVYLQGAEESTHGLSDTLLSVIGVRAGEVVADLNSD